MKFFKKQRAWLVATTLLLTVGTLGQGAPGAKPQQATPAQTSTTATADFVTALAKAHNAFGYKLMEQVCPASAPKNFIYSPAGTTILLDLTLAHSQGVIHDELAKALGLKDVAPGSIQPAAAALRTVILRAGMQMQYELSWTSPKGPTKEFRRFFTKDMKGTLNPPKHWSDEPWPFELKSTTRFEQRWYDEWQENGQLTFYNLDGTNGIFPKLEREGMFTYLKGDGFQAARLPYGDGDTYLTIYLPDTKDGLPSLLKKAYSPEWISMYDQFQPYREGTVVLPSFRIGVDGSLRETLESIGIRTAFSVMNAYPGLFSNPALLTSLDHKCKMEVTKQGIVIIEEGVEGGVEGGVVGGVLGGGPPPPPPFMMLVDHPFLFELWDKNSGSLLFIGVVTCPAPMNIPVKVIKR
jgi:serpin B